jgi:hypothetical protein
MGIFAGVTSSSEAARITKRITVEAIRAEDRHPDSGGDYG